MIVVAWYPFSALPGNGGILAVKNENHARSYEPTNPGGVGVNRLPSTAERQK